MCTQTLLATPLFDWDTSNGSVNPSLKPGAWLYLAVTVPLTLVTLAIWALYMWTKKRQGARKDAIVGEMSKDEESG